MSGRGDYCHGCGALMAGDTRPWLLITGWRMPRGLRIPFAEVVCPDCEESLSWLADVLHDLMGVRLADNTPATLATALKGWPAKPGSG
jgi:hypothetical protein